MGRFSSSALAKMNSSARVVLPEPGAPMMMLIEFSGMPPPRISSSSRLPVVRRWTGGSMTSRNMLGSPEPCASRFEDLPHGVDQRVFGERLQEESVGSGFPGAAAGRENAEDEDRDVAGLRIRLEPAAEGEPVEHGHQDLRDDDLGFVAPRLLQGSVAVRGESDRIAGLVQEVGFELANVRIPIHDEDDRFTLGQVGHRPRSSRRRDGYPRWDIVD